MRKKRTKTNDSTATVKESSLLVKTEEKLQKQVFPVTEKPILEDEKLKFSKRIISIEELSKEQSKKIKIHFSVDNNIIDKMFYLMKKKFYLGKYSKIS